MRFHAAIDRNKQIDFITNIFMQVAFLIHFFWAFLFFGLDIPLLGYVNLVSSLIYIVGFYINKRGYTLTALYMGHLEILAHASLATYILGSGAGFHYFIVHAIILTFIALKPSNLVKSIIVFFNMVILSILSLSFKAPTIAIDGMILDALLLMNIVFVSITLAFLTFLYRKVTDATEEHLMNLNQKLEIYANTDTLTSLLNRRSMLEKMKKAEADFAHHQKPFTLILADIDNFKSINDFYGHDCGDMVLKETANFLRGHFQDQPVARWGGEEFLILLLDTEINEAQLIVENLRQRFEQEITFAYQGKTIKIALTYGLSEYNDGEVNVLDTINNADKALIQGKNQGKNSIVKHGDGSKPVEYK